LEVADRMQKSLGDEVVDLVGIVAASSLELVSPTKS